MKTVLCIGGLDPAGRAGIFADARAVAAMGARPLCVATALTFQSSKRVDGYETVSSESLQRQIQTLVRDEPIDAVKLGQLASAENAAVVASLKLDAPMVIDTPLVSSSGAALFPPEAVRASYRSLMTRAALVTPNAVEVFLLAGETLSVERETAERAARLIDARAVLLKGGHIDGANVVDVLWRGSRARRYTSPRLNGRFRGTGCRLASAIAARLAMGDELEVAIEVARTWLFEQLQNEV